MALPAHLIAHFPYFAAVAQHQSFTIAAQYLHVSQAAVSYQIRQLEAKLNITLVIRQSGSKLYLTSAGQALAAEYRGCEERLQLALTTLQPHNLAATIRITAPVDFASTVLPHVLVLIRQQAPTLRVQLEVTDSVTDVIAQGVDFAFRTQPLDERLQHALVGYAHKALVASPQYLATHCTPKTLEDLSQHCLLVRGVGQYFSWNQLLATAQLHLDTAHYSTLVLGNTYALETGARAGLGLALLAEFAVAASIERGELVRVMPDATHPLTTPFYLSYFATPQTTAIKALIWTALQTTLQIHFANAFKWERAI